MWWSCNYAVTNGQTEGPLMSLSASEQQALDSIEATLTSADPKLVSLLATFARLACPFTGGFSAVTASVWPVPGAVRLRAGARTALSAMGALPSLGYG
jgi:Protein of unknown function (DUF3040)